MSGVQDYLIDQEVKKIKQLAEIVISKALPTTLDLLKGMAKWLSRENKQEGQLTLKQLTKYGDKLSTVPLNSDSVKAFTHIARKHGVTFTLTADSTQTPPRHTVYFKAQDTEAMTAAFKEYIAKEIKRGKNKEKSFKVRLKEAKEKVKVADKEKLKRREVEGR